MDACEILHTAEVAIGDRASQRDLPSGERTMVRIIGAFEQLTRVCLTEQQGWLFMCMVKAARATAGAHRLDDYIDLAGYAALAGEAAERDNQTAPALRPARQESAPAIAAMLAEAAERDE